MSARVLLDPTNEARAPQRERPPRIDSVEGRTIGLLDISKPKGNVFLDTLEAALRERGAEVERYAKPTFAKLAPVDLRHEIATRCDAVVEALAD